VVVEHGLPVKLMLPHGQTPDKAAAETIIGEPPIAGIDPGTRVCDAVALDRSDRCQVRQWSRPHSKRRKLDSAVALVASRPWS